MHKQLNNKDMAVIYGKKNKWSKSILTYWFTNSAPNGALSQNDAEVAFQRACDQWAVPTGLSFKKGNDRKADILVTWKAIDGAGDILGRSEFPHGKDDQVNMYFDNSEKWTNSDFLWNTTNFHSVALHELGHAIGLNHSANPAAVMFHYDDEFLVTSKANLSQDDIDGANYLYKQLDKGIMISNTTDKILSWFAYNSDDSFKWVALNSGDLASNEFKLFRPVGNNTGKYFIRFTQRGGGTEIAGAIMGGEGLISIFSVGSNGAKIQIT
jgi:hypothetical protein